MSECDEGLSFEGILNTAEDCIQEVGGEWECAVNWARELQGLHGEQTTRRIIQIINLRFSPPPFSRQEFEELPGRCIYGSP